MRMTHTRVRPCAKYQKRWWGGTVMQNKDNSLMKNSSKSNFVWHFPGTLSAECQSTSSSKVIVALKCTQPLTLPHLHKSQYLMWNLTKKNSTDNIVMSSYNGSEEVIKGTQWH